MQLRPLPAHLSTAALLAPLHLPHAWLHSDGRTALSVASGEGHSAVVDALIAANADVNARAKYYDGQTALHFASGKGHSAVVDTLIAAKADVNARTKYYNAVLFAAHLGTAALLAPLHLPHAPQ